jgi:hypothetical protein
VSGPHVGGWLGGFSIIGLEILDAYNPDSSPAYFSTRKEIQPMKG